MVPSQADWLVEAATVGRDGGSADSAPPLERIGSIGFMCLL